MYLLIAGAIDSFKVVELNGQKVLSYWVDAARYTVADAQDFGYALEATGDKTSSRFVVAKTEDGKVLLIAQDSGKAVQIADYIASDFAECWESERCPGDAYITTPEVLSILIFLEDENCM